MEKLKKYMKEYFERNAFIFLEGIFAKMGGRKIC